MKLKPLEPKFEATLTSKLSKKISSKFRYQIMDNKPKGDIESIIVLGNGNVDDYTIPIICHHLNGNKIVGITKPEGKHRNATLSEFPTYISRLKINKLALVMDQENQELDEIFEQIENELGNRHIQFRVNEDLSGDQIKHYQCEFVNKTFDFILIISGLLDIQTNTHKIEDHLVKAALRLSKMSNSNPQDTKEIWNSLDARLQSEILNYFVNSMSFSSEVFPQHFKGLRLLEE